VRLKFFFIFGLFGLTNISFLDYNEPKTRQILSQMFDSIKNVRTLRAHVSSVERVEKTYHLATSELKLQTHPRKLYFLNSQKKLEILYNPEKYSSKAIVKPHVFPYLTVHLDPTGNLMRKNQHYTINELGYGFIGTSVALTISKDKDGITKFTHHGKVRKGSYNCYLLEYENKNFSYSNYIVKDRETATSISYKLCVNDYLLRYKNDLLNDFGYLKKGSILKVPNLYCKKATLYIDDKLLLPISISLFDEEGLFENYEFSNLVVNKSINEEEFTKNYSSYGF